MINNIDINYLETFLDKKIEPNLETFLHKSRLKRLNRNSMITDIIELVKNPQKHPYEALVMAAQVGETKIFFYLYDKYNPEIMWTDEYNNDLMQSAVTSEQIAIVKFLREKGHGVNHPGRYNITPLMRACMYVSRKKKKMKEIIIYLLNNEALTSPIDDFGHNALFYAKQRCLDDELCDRLIPEELRLFKRFEKT